MKVGGAVVLGVSMMYATTLGNEDATASVMIAPDADQVKISICPGVSMMIWLPKPALAFVDEQCRSSVTRVPPLSSP